jgi:hypothetical protein
MRSIAWHDIKTTRLFGAEHRPFLKPAATDNK